MIGFGAAVGLAGAWLLILKRPSSKQVPLHLAGKEPIPTGVSEPTRLTTAITALIGGFHLVIWAWPPNLTAVQLNRQIWYVWVLIGIVAVGLSAWLDRVERRSPPENRDT